ncbi:hypothetical protein [Veillonella rogosae]|uniref:hypothetical protein n=1 Tax=Veillonella rogosae TaxID=423477 RepID=UPI00209320E7|nr:hypothetical protein [Veillonella rogosae]
MLPIVLSVFWMATITIYKAYYWDHILQDTITYVEEGKAAYYETGTLQTGVHHSQFIMSLVKLLVIKHM